MRHKEAACIIEDNGIAAAVNMLCDLFILAIEWDAANKLQNT